LTIVFFLTVLFSLISYAAIGANPPDLMQTAKNQKKEAGGKAEDQVQLRENLDIGEIDSIIAKLSDEQVRRL
jgi:hypothetical protein